MNQTITLKEEMKSLYKQLDNKMEFVEALAEKLNRKPRSIANHWFSRFWDVPYEFQQQVKELLEETIKNQ